MVTKREREQRRNAGRASIQTQREALGAEGFSQRQSDKGTRGGRPIFEASTRKDWARHAEALRQAPRGRGNYGKEISSTLPGFWHA